MLTGPIVSHLPFFVNTQGDGYIRITITDDDIVESVETFRIRLSHVTGGARLGKEVSAVISIAPNDSPLGSFGFEVTMVHCFSLFFRNKFVQI